MSYNPVYAINLQEFRTLVSESGLGTLSGQLEKLTEHRVLVPLDVVDSSAGPRFYALQLYILHVYDEITRYHAHPWGEHVPLGVESDLKKLKKTSMVMTALVKRLRGEADDVPPRAEVQAMLDELDRAAQKVNPFGALSSMFELIRYDVLSTLRGDGRLYGEFLWGGLRIKELYHSALLSSQIPESTDEMRATQDMEAVVMDSVLSEPAPVLKDKPVVVESEPAPEPVPASDEAPSARVTMEISEADAQSLRPSPPAKEVAEVEEPEVEISEVEMPEVDEFDIEELEEPEVESASTPAPNPFAKPKMPSTQANTTDLQQRLAALKKSSGVTGGSKLSLAQKAIALSKAKKSQVEDAPVLDDEELIDVESDLPELDDVPNTEELRDVSEQLAVEDSEDLLIELSQEAPLVLDDDEMEDIFDDDSQTVVLDGKDLRAQAEEDSSPLVVEDEPVDEPSSAESQEIDEEEWQRRIEELNRKREEYMSAQNWNGLVALYEDGVGLFEAAERQQVYLTLAKLYELKIGDTKRALESMALAFELGGDTAILLKIAEAMKRFADGSARQPLMDWVDAQIASGQLDFVVMEALQRLRAQLLQEDGDAQRAFLTYAAFVADSSDRAASDAGLDFLESLAQGVDATELYELYDELIEEALDPTLSYHLSSRAGFFALQRDDLVRAMPYLEQAIERDPAQEQLFHILEQLYEEQGEMPALMVLFERRLRAVSGALRDAIAERHASLRQQEVAAREVYRDDYMSRLEAKPQDDVLLECIMRSYLEEEQYIDGYAFLNRHLTRLSAVASRVRALKTLGMLALQHLDSPEEAMVHLEKALELGGARKSLLERLIMISLEQEDWSKVLLYIERLTGELSQEMNEEEQVRWLLAGVQAAQSLEDVARERHFLEQTLRIDPEHEQARQALEAIS